MTTYLLNNAPLIAVTLLYAAQVAIDIYRRDLMAGVVAGFVISNCFFLMMKWGR